MRTGKQAGSSSNPMPSAHWRPIGGRSGWFKNQRRGEEEPGFIPVGIPRDRQLSSSHGILVSCACSVEGWGPLQTLLHLSTKGGHTGNLVWSFYRFWVLICRLCWIVFCLYNIKYVRKYSFERFVVCMNDGFYSYFKIWMPESATVAYKSKSDEGAR